MSQEWLQHKHASLWLLFHVREHLWFLHAAHFAPVVSLQLGNIKQIHTLSRWFIADISASHFAMRRRSAPGHSRASGCTKGRSAWLGQCKHPIQNALYIHAGHTHSHGHTLKSWRWHVACTWPSFIAPVCPLWLSVLCVEVLCEQLGWRLQAPELGHLISPGWPWGLQSWGNTIHKGVLICTGAPLHCAANKTPQRLFDCIPKSQPYFR